jgi:hypothetical protein
MKIIRTHIPDTASLKELITLTGELMQQGQLGKLKSCFDSIDTLLVDGDSTLKEAIHSIYIPSLTKLIEDFHIKTPLINLMPSRLLHEYQQEKLLHS